MKFLARKEDMSVPTWVAMLAAALRSSAFGLCVAWSFCLFSIPEFSCQLTGSPFMVSMGSGAAVCAAFLVTGPWAQVDGNRTGATLAAAVLVALGSLALTLPLLTGSWGALAALGLSSAALFVLLLAWFNAYASLSIRVAIVSGALSLLVAAAACWAVAQLPNRESAIATSALPLLSFLFLPAYSREKATTKPSETPLRHRSDGYHAVGSLPLLGLALVGFTAEGLQVLDRMEDSFLGTPTIDFLAMPAIAATFIIVTACACPRRATMGAIAKLLFSLYGIALALSTFAVSAGPRLAFALSLATPIYGWMLLAVLAHERNSAAGIVFCWGWAATLLGSAIAAALSHLLTVEPALLSIGLAIAMVAAVALVFSRMSLSPPSFPESDDGLQPDDEINRESRPESDELSAFCARYCLSERERQVLKLWIAGRSMRYIREELFISESTVKTHLRHIYDKCNVHNRDELVRAFEEFDS